MFLRVLIFAILVCGVTTAAAHAKELSIAIVDVEKILVEAKAAKSLQKQIQAKKESFQKEFAGKEKELKDAENALIAEKGSLSAEEFGKKRKAYEGKVIAARKLFQKSRNSLDVGVGKSMKTLRKNIVEAAAKIADDKGFDVILTRDGVLLAGKDLDITNDVLKQMDDAVSEIKLDIE